MARVAWLLLAAVLIAAFWMQGADAMRRPRALEQGDDATKAEREQMTRQKILEAKSKAQSARAEARSVRAAAPASAAAQDNPAASPAKPARAAPAQGAPAAAAAAGVKERLAQHGAGRAPVDASDAAARLRQRGVPRV